MVQITYTMNPAARHSTQRKDTMDNPVLEALKQTTVLACIETGALGLERIDRAASDKANAAAGAVHKAAAVKVNRLAGADEYHKKIISIQHEATALLKACSQPFGEEDKWRMLPNVHFEPFVQKLAPIAAEFNKAVEDLRFNAAGVLRRAANNVGDFDVGELPTPEQMVGSYRLRPEFRPIPEGSNFRGLSEGTIEKLRQRHDARLEEAVHIAQHNTLERFVDPLNNFVQRMVAFDKREEEINAGKHDKKNKTGVFRDSVVSNIKELHDVLKSFNITGDEKFDELYDGLKELVVVKPDTLRDNQPVREAMTARARQVVDNLKAWGI